MNNLKDLNPNALPGTILPPWMNEPLKINPLIIISGIALLFFYLMKK